MQDDEEEYRFGCSDNPRQTLNRINGVNAMRKERKKRNRSKNVGNLDSIIRVALGSVILIAGFVYGNWWGLVGLVPVVTGAISWCPLYYVFGIRTCSTDIELEV